MTDQRAGEENDEQYSPAYFIYTFLVGITLLFTFVWLGYANANVYFVVLVGGAVQTVHRVVKRYWQRRETGRISGGEDTAIEKNVLLSTALIYVAMCLVTLLWYGVGAGIAYLVN